MLVTKRGKSNALHSQFSVRLIKMVALRRVWMSSPRIASAREYRLFRLDYERRTYRAAAALIHVVHHVYLVAVAVQSPD